MLQEILKNVLNLTKGRGEDTKILEPRGVT